MISRRGVILAAAIPVLALCASCGNVKEVDEDRNEGSLEAVDGNCDEDGPEVARKHISPDDVVDVFLFSLSGLSIAEIDAENLQETIEVLSNLDSETSEEPAVVPDGGVSGGRVCMFFVVLKSSETLTVGTDGFCAIYDSVYFESGSDACQRMDDLYSRLIKSTQF